MSDDRLGQPTEAELNPECPMHGTAPESVPEVRDECPEGPTGDHFFVCDGDGNVLATNGTALCEHCGYRVPWPSDQAVETFMAAIPWAGHLPAYTPENVRAALAAVAPLIEADVGERIAAAMVETPADRVTWDDGTEFISSADAQRIARAVATGDEGGR